MIDKMKNLILQAKERIYISVSARELEHVKEELEAACSRNLKVVIISDPSFHLNNAAIYHLIKQPGSIRLITDTSNVLTGEILEEGTANCLFSRNKTLIALIKDSLTNEMKQLQMNGDPGSIIVNGGTNDGK